jgi:hypothetical protein
MSGPTSFNCSETPANHRQGTAAAMALACEIRKELMDRPVCPPDAEEQSVYRLIHYVNPTARTGPQPAVTVSRDELNRLQRIVNLLTTAVGELNLWLINAGRDPVEIEP